jgi:hypothetical protein
MLLTCFFSSPNKRGKKTFLLSRVILTKHLDTESLFYIFPQTAIPKSLVLLDINKNEYVSIKLFLFSSLCFILVKKFSSF